LVDRNAVMTACHVYLEMLVSLSNWNQDLFEWVIRDGWDATQTYHPQVGQSSDSVSQAGSIHQL